MDADTHARALTHARTHAYTCTPTHTHTYTHTHARTRTHARTHKRTHARTHTLTHTHTHTHTLTHGRTHARTHARTHTHTQNLILCLSKAGPQICCRSHTRCPGTVNSQRNADFRPRANKDTCHDPEGMHGKRRSSFNQS